MHARALPGPRTLYISTVKSDGISSSRPSGSPPGVAQSRVKPTASAHGPASAEFFFQWWYMMRDCHFWYTLPVAVSTGWYGRRSGHEVDACFAGPPAGAAMRIRGSGAAFCSVAFSRSASTSAAAAACSVARPEASVSSDVSTRFCCWMSALTLDRMRASTWTCASAAGSCAACCMKSRAVPNSTSAAKRFRRAAIACALLALGPDSQQLSPGGVLTQGTKKPDSRDYFSIQ